MTVLGEMLGRLSMMMIIECERVTASERQTASMGWRGVQVAVECRFSGFCVLNVRSFLVMLFRIRT